MYRCIVGYMQGSTQAKEVARLEDNYSYVVAVDTYSHFETHTVKVEVEEGTHGTACMMDELRSVGFELQNVDMEHNRFTFRQE